MAKRITVLDDTDIENLMNNFDTIDNKIELLLEEIKCKDKTFISEIMRKISIELSNIKSNLRLYG